MTSRSYGIFVKNTKNLSGNIDVFYDKLGRLTNRRVMYIDKTYINKYYHYHGNTNKIRCKIHIYSREKYYSAKCGMYDENGKLLQFIKRRYFAKYYDECILDFEKESHHTSRKKL